MSNTFAAPVLVVHGALGSATQMAPVVDALRAAGVTASALELPGHGNTPVHDGAFTMAAFADHVARAAWALGDARPVCFGYSMGGYAALLAEQDHPGTFAAIVTLGTMLTWTPEIATQGATRLDPDTVRAKVPAFADQLAARHAGAGGWELLMGRTARLLRALGDAPPLSAAGAAHIACPVTCLVGSRDDSVVFGDTAAFAAALPRGHAELLDGVPHPIEKVPLDRIVATLVAALVAATSDARP